MSLTLPCFIRITPEWAAATGGQTGCGRMREDCTRNAFAVWL
jgi:hypothetical protein